jgi:hypothetical protein
MLQATLPIAWIVEAANSLSELAMYVYSEAEHELIGCTQQHGMGSTHPELSQDCVYTCLACHVGYDIQLVRERTG